MSLPTRLQNFLKTDGVKSRWKGLSDLADMCQNSDQTKTNLKLAAGHFNKATTDAITHDGPRQCIELAVMAYNAALHAPSADVGIESAKDEFKAAARNFARAQQ